jgi:hypothetical protein
VYGFVVICGFIAIAVSIAFLFLPHHPETWAAWLWGFVVGVTLAPTLSWLRGLAEEVRNKALGLKKCPFCAGWVGKKANVCKFCHKEMPPAVPTKT